MVWLLRFVVLFSFTVDEVLRLGKMNGFSRYLVAQLEEETRATVNVVYGRKMMRIHYVQANEDYEVLKMGMPD